MLTESTSVIKEMNELNDVMTKESSIARVDRATPSDALGFRFEPFSIFANKITPRCHEAPRDARL